MYKKLLLVLMLAGGLSACKNTENDSACGTQMCTASFAYIGVMIKDSNGDTVKLSALTVVNLRTNKSVTPPEYPGAVDFMEGSVLIASDNNRADFSTKGDEVEITATSEATGQVKKFTMKISGGCNCHIEKISGPETVTFD
ncbi:hypothetical protein EWM62_11450 [Mucilaginibacter terrigena]|uniref:Uncharacterized protein n=1 Tax=Mucilaginibacter terrigena TaxID=2492395 RepID=A0A4Q5LNE9_9SPHI|nr:hypothetical protein [Mucilaginibacter terrigena]RYU90149.1 hypothetical protein EWM62_11450 [Mucilaginibacter terrigena]